jgi:hypothetical protein
VDAVLLMAEALVLGGPTPHVAIPGMDKPLTLFRGKDALGVRYQGPFSVNGQPAEGRVVLPPVASITGEEFSFAIEPAG